MCNKLTPTSITLSGGVLTITVQPGTAYVNYKKYRMELCIPLPAITGAEPVAVFDGTNTYALLDTYGQPIVSGRLCKGKAYMLGYGSGGEISGGTMPPHFVLFDLTCAMKYSSNAALQGGMY